MNFVLGPDVTDADAVELERRAEEAYKRYDHGTDQMDQPLEAGPWWRVEGPTVGAHVLRRMVLFRPRPIERPGPLPAVVFVVVFHEGSFEVSEAYYDVKP